MGDVNDKPRQLPIHPNLDASEYAIIETATKLRGGQPLEPVAEYTRFGWTVLSPGTEDGLTKRCLLNQRCKITRSSVIWMYLA